MSLVIKKAIRDHVNTHRLLYTCPVIVPEVLSGATSANQLRMLNEDVDDLELLGVIHLLTRAR